MNTLHTARTNTHMLVIASGQQGGQQCAAATAQSRCSSRYIANHCILLEAGGQSRYNKTDHCSSHQLPILEKRDLRSKTRTKPAPHVHMIGAVRACTAAVV